MRSTIRSIPLASFVALLLAASLAWTWSLTDDVRVTGRVLRAGTGAPIPAAQVFVGVLGRGTLTDQAGRYALDVPRAALVRDGVRLTVQRIGFRQEEVVLRVPDDFAEEVLTVDVRLHEEALRLDEIAVAGIDAAARRHAEVRLARPAAPVHGPTAWPGWNREQYAHIEENDFRSAHSNPLSTFSIDVDRASYSNVRRFLLGERRLPPVDAVQVEEMINYFSYDYALPEGRHPLAVTTELGVAPWREGHRLLRIGLASRPIDTSDMPASNLVFLLDVSGSMTSPDKLPLVKRSMGLLVNQLRPVDRVAIVVYAGAAGLVLEPTPGDRKDRILDAIERLEAGGSTAGGAGLRLAYRVAQESFMDGGNNRVILATDGDFNVGESSDSEMIRLIEERRGRGTFLTVLGFGTGNLQSAKMQALAQNGNGNWAYIDSLDEARKVLVGEMGGTLVTVAQDVKIQVEFNPAVVRAYRLIGYENRLLAAEDFNDDAKDAGELGAGHTVTALYEIVPVGVDTDVEVSEIDPLRYQAPERLSDRAPSDELAFVRVRYKRPRGAKSHLLEQPVGVRIGHVSTDLTFAAAVAGFGMLLRDSGHRGSITAGQVMALARDGLGADDDGYRKGFIELVRAYDELKERATDRR